MPPTTAGIRGVICAAIVSQPRRRMTYGSQQWGVALQYQPPTLGVASLRDCGSGLRVPDPGLALGPALGKRGDQSVTAPRQVWFWKVARA